MPVSGRHADRSPRPEPRYQPLVIVLTAAVAGILTDRFWPLPLAAWAMLATTSLVLWGVVSISPLGRQLHCLPSSDQTGDGSATAIPTFRPRRTSLLLGNILLLVAVAATAGAWRHCCWNLFGADDLGCYAQRTAQPVCVEAVAVESPRALPPRTPDAMQGMPTHEGTRLIVKLVSLRNGTTWQPVSGRATLLVLGEPPEVEAGDRIRCFGTLSAPRGPQNPGEFDLAARLRADRVRSRLLAEVPECVSVVEAGSNWNIWRQLERVRSHGKEVLKRYLDPRRAELADAVLLGLREEIDAGRSEAFLTTGTVHILCVAGLHVGILAWALFGIMRRMRISRGWAVAAVATLVIFYALMVDAGPSVVRATILILVACSAIWLGRLPLGFNSLAAAALVVLAINPAHLFQVGPHLSFLTVAGLIWFAGHRPHSDDNLEGANKTLERLIMQNLGWLSWTRRKLSHSAMGLLQAGAVLWLLTLPLILARFHILSPIALVMNTVLWLLMFVCLISGFCVLIVGTICPPLGILCGWVCNLSFGVLEGGVDLAQQIPHWWLPGPADWWLLGFYGALGLALAFPRICPPWRWCMALLFAWIALGSGVAVCRHDRDRLDCTFLSVGHGCAVFIEFPSGRTMLYDAGRMGEPSVGARTIAEFLWDRGRARLDAVVLSHPDSDHYNALPELLDKFSVGAVYVSPVMFEKKNYAIAELREAIDRHRVPMHEVRAGDRLPAGDDCAVEVLYPRGQGIPGLDNANSLVLAVEYRGRRIVLPGDLESPGLDAMLAQRPRPCDVLMAPHHGSRRSNSPGLAAWCKPRWVVFSGDKRWSLPEIDATYQAVGGKTLHTHDCGAIRVLIGENGVDVSQFVKP